MGARVCHTVLNVTTSLEMNVVFMKVLRVRVLEVRDGRYIVTKGKTEWDTIPWSRRECFSSRLSLSYEDLVPVWRGEQSL